MHVITYFLFYFFRFEEVWNETNNRLRFTDQLGFTEIPPSNYQTIGTDHLVLLLRKLEIPVKDSKCMHSISDREGFATLISQKSKDDRKDPFTVNMSLFGGLSSSNTWDLDTWYALLFNKLG